MMTKWRSLVMAAACAVALGFCSSAKAGPISYTYAGVSGSPASGFQIVHPIAGNGGVAFVGETGTGSGPGTSGAFGAFLFAVPSNNLGVGTFNNTAYSTGLTITDSAAPGSPHTFMFGGQLNGTLVAGTDTLTNSFTTPTSQQFQIGNNMYTVQINSLALPGLGSPGAVTYNVTATASLVNSVPEPSTLLLSGLGASCLGFFSWRRRRAAEALARAAAE